MVSSARRFGRSDHPVCAFGAATPPLRGGEYCPAILLRLSGDCSFRCDSPWGRSCLDAAVVSAPRPNGLYILDHPCRVSNRAVGRERCGFSIVTAYRSARAGTGWLSDPACCCDRRKRLYSHACAAILAGRSVAMVTLDPGEIGVGCGLDIDEVLIEQIKTHVRRKSTPARVIDAGADRTTSGRNIRKHVDVIILCPTQLTLIEVLKNLGPVVLEIAKAHVQQGRGRDGPVVVHPRRVIHLVL